MNKTEYLLTCLAEECNEVAHRVSKALRFGLDEIQPGQPLNNRARIAQELSDLYTVVHLLNKEGVVFTSDKPSPHKLEKIEKFMAYSRLLGAL